MHKKCIYKCKEGTKQSGVGTELSVTCEPDGLWSATSIFCRRTCPSPITPPHARPHFKTLAKRCHRGKMFIPGETCSYRCKTGYKPMGVYQNKDVLDQRCLKDGSWTTKRCVPVTCPVRDPNIFRWYNCTMGDKYGSVCRLACPDEKVKNTGVIHKWLHIKKSFIYFMHTRKSITCCYSIDSGVGRYLIIGLKFRKKALAEVGGSEGILPREIF